MISICIFIGIDRHKNWRGFTLTEMLVVVVMAAIGMAVFYTVFLTQWVGLDYHLARAEMWQELNKAVEEMAFEGRHASFFEVRDSSDHKDLILKDIDDKPYRRFRITSDGRLIRFDEGSPEKFAVITTELDVTSSDFDLKDRNALITLVRTKPILLRKIAVAVTTEVSPRN